MKGTPIGVQTGKAPNETSAIVDHGMVDFKSFVAAAEKVGVKHYYLEDEHPNAVKPQFTISGVMSTSHRADSSADVAEQRRAADLAAFQEDLASVDLRIVRPDPA